MQAPVLKPIETRWKGYRFRSRLEARWAVFFDALNVPYRYEAEGYDLNGILYLPDFWLEQQDCWIEIKPTKPTKEERGKAELLAEASGKRVFIFSCGIPSVSDAWVLWECGTGPCDSAEAFFPGGGWDNNYYWCRCTTCGMLGIEFNGRSDRLSCKQCSICAALMAGKTHWLAKDGRCPHHSEQYEIGCPRSEHGDKGYTFDDPLLEAAYVLARSARFEHGQRG